MPLYLDLLPEPFLHILLILPPETPTAAFLLSFYGLGFYNNKRIDLLRQLVEYLEQKRDHLKKEIDRNRFDWDTKLKLQDYLRAVEEVIMEKEHLITAMLLAQGGLVVWSLELINQLCR